MLMPTQLRVCRNTLSWKYLFNTAVNTVDSLLKNSAINSWKVITSSLNLHKFDGNW